MLHMYIEYTQINKKYYIFTYFNQNAVVFHFENMFYSEICLI